MLLRLLKAIAFDCILLLADIIFSVKGIVYGE